MAMVPRGRSSSLPVIYVAGLQRVNPEIDPEAERGPAAVGRRKSRRPSVLDALVPKSFIPAAAPSPESPEHAWEALCNKSKQLPKPDLDANPPLSIEDIRRAALTEWVAEVGNAAISGYYWPSHDKIKAWLAQWPEWEASPEPPSWFTEEWKGRVLGVVPPGLLPAEVRPRVQSFLSRMSSRT